MYLYLYFCIYIIGRYQVDSPEPHMPMRIHLVFERKCMGKGEGPRKSRGKGKEEE